MAAASLILRLSAYKTKDGATRRGLSSRALPISALSWAVIDKPIINKALLLEAIFSFPKYFLDSSYMYEEIFLRAWSWRRAKRATPSSFKSSTENGNTWPYGTHFLLFSIFLFASKYFFPWPLKVGLTRLQRWSQGHHFFLSCYERLVKCLPCGGGGKSGNDPSLGGSAPGRRSHVSRFFNYVRTSKNNENTGLMVTQCMKDIHNSDVLVGSGPSTGNFPRGPF